MCILLRVNILEGKFLSLSFPSAFQTIFVCVIAFHPYVLSGAFVKRLPYAQGKKNGFARQTCVIESCMSSTAWVVADAGAVIDFSSPLT